MSVSSAFDGTNIQGVTTRHRGVGPGGAAARRNIGHGSLGHGSRDQGGMGQGGSLHGNVYPLNARRRGAATSQAPQGAGRGFRRPDQAAAAAAHPARTLRLLRCPADPAGGVHPVVQRIPQRSRESGRFRRPALADADRIRHSATGGVPLGHCRVGGSGARSPRRRGRHRAAEQSGRRACDAGPATVRPVQVTTPGCRRGRHSFSARPATT